MNYPDLKVMTIDEAMSNYDDKTEFCLEDEVYEMYSTYEKRIKELNKEIENAENRIKDLSKELKESQAKWITVKSRKPKKHQIVICVDADNDARWCFFNGRKFIQGFDFDVKAKWWIEPPPIHASSATEKDGK